MVLNCFSKINKCFPSGPSLRPVRHHSSQLAVSPPLNTEVSFASWPINAYSKKGSCHCLLLLTMLSRHYPSVNGSLAQPFAATFLLCCISAQWLCFPTTVFSHTRTRQWLSFGVNIPLYKNLINLYTARMLRRADRKPQCLWWYDICCVLIFEARRNRFADLAPFPVYCRLRLSAPALATADQWAVLAFYIVSQPKEQ